ncbi:hypothetical protein PCC7424_0225 [Gloeothece citriformis PCC 7424]|uniref:Uncharacterized protein n=1 Tax=Gloeothece citriformis (strain PCC 7424) TaxID=65393 RepID=B7KAM1_GLOC7|nr:EcsC family protein [Gloeothece citriformis]ACK68693.1 hypothetical protein PCC7424_0225 [Gloeothece citriformis PCC 7424]
MLTIESTLVSSIPGRIRLKIPQLYKDSDYRSKLQTLLESYPQIDKVVIHPLSSSLIVYYNHHLLSTEEIQSKIEIALNQLATEKLSNPGVIAFNGYQSISLTAYESLQVKKIYQWRKKQPAFLTALTGQIFSPLKIIVDKILPDRFIRNLVKAIETSSQDWPKTWEHLKPKAGVEDYQQLKQAPLEKCDQLAHEIKDKALIQASFDGGLTGFFEWLGEIADVGLTISLAVATIHKIGLCYGYSPTTTTERQFTWAILKVSTALTPQERQEALELLHHFQHLLYKDDKQVIEDIIEDSTLGTMEEGAIEEMISKIIQDVFDNELVETIPVIGLGLGILADRKMIEEVAEAAHREFQLRWLLEKQKMSLSNL